MLQSTQSDLAHVGQDLSRARGSILIGLRSSASSIAESSKAPETVITSNVALVGMDRINPEYRIPVPPVRATLFRPGRFPFPVEWQWTGVVCLTEEEGSIL